MSSERVSSSSTSSTSEWKYDVFLSFRGEDTRRGFTNYLYTELIAQGIETFMDDRELQKGKSISPELFTAIEESNFAVVVLSPNYASSAWCLDELLKILECMEARKTILPIFYDVEAFEVRRQTGNIAKSFAKHEKRLMDDREKVPSWRDALTKVSNLFGWNAEDCRQTDKRMEDAEKVQRWRAALTKISNFSGWNSKDRRHELDLIKDIVAAVRTQLRPTLFSSMENLIGIDSRVEGVNNLLLGVRVDDVHFIGIWGMGGIGKTTVAKVLFDRISYQFEFSSFISDVRSIEETSGLVQLQKKLISKLMGKEIDVWDVNEGATMLKRSLRHKKVLLVLDDVNQLNQLDYLAGKKDWFGLGSKIIITTRDDHLLVNHGVMRRFEVQGLNTNEALQLFCLHAFKKGYPEQRYRDLSNQVVNYAKGLPLALKVLGSFFHGRGLSAWEDALTKLRKDGNADIFKILKISYDGLDDDQKKIFLEISCFYQGCEKMEVIIDLDICGSHATIGIDVLVERSLLTISDDGTLQIHDLLQEMGRDIVRRECVDEPGKRSRLYLKEDIAHVLNKNTGTDAVETIRLRPYEDTELHLHGNSFSMIKNLRRLAFGKRVYVHLFDDLKCLSSELRHIEWWKFPLQSLESLPNLEKLHSIFMAHSRIEYLWEGKKPLHGLKHICLRHSLNLRKTPDFSGSPNLEILDLEGCIKLDEVDSSVGFLEKLAIISFRGCKNLRLLPNSVSGLKSFKYLNVSNCSKLEKLPEELGHLESLECLTVDGTALRELPSCTGLKNLKKLYFCGCTGPPISKLLPSFAGLHSLTDMNLSHINLLEGAIPNDIGCLSSLRDLRLAGNQFFSLPESLSQLYRLELLFLVNCPNLQKLPKLPSRVQVYAIKCISLEIVPEHLSAAYFINCLKLGKHGSTVAFTSMKQHLQEVSQDRYVETRNRLFWFIISGNEIPEWFDHQSTVPSVSIDLHPGWFNKEFVGFAVCAVFAVHGHCQLPPIGGYWDGISYVVKVDGQELNSVPPVEFNFYHVLGRAVSDHLWFTYDNSLSSYFRLTETTESKQIEFLFRVKVRGLVVKKCGVRLVYKQDVADFNQSNADISEEALEIPCCDSGKAAVAISRHGGGGPSGGGFSFYKEPQPDSLERLKSASAGVQKPLPPSYLSDLIKSHPNRRLVPPSLSWRT